MPDHREAQPGLAPQRVSGIWLRTGAKGTWRRIVGRLDAVAPQLTEAGVTRISVNTTRNSSRGATAHHPNP
jgi:hypothetical protein